MGSGPGSACTARGALGCIGVAGSKPSDAGEGSASPHPGEARVGPGAHSGGVRPRFSLRCRRRARLQGRRRDEAERHRGGCSPSCRAKPGSGWEPIPVGSGPDSACAAGGARWGKGVAGPKASYTGVGAPSPYAAKPGSGRGPTRVGSCPDSACAAEGAPGCKGAVRQKPSNAEEGAASPHPGDARFRRSLGRARSPLEWGPADGQEARYAARAPTGRSGETQGRVKAPPSVHCACKIAPVLCGRGYRSPLSEAVVNLTYYLSAFILTETPRSMQQRKCSRRDGNAHSMNPMIH